MRFYRILVVVLFCGILTTNSHAQSFGGGIIAGASTSQVAGDMLGGFNKIGLLAGAYTNLKIKENLKLQLEIKKYLELRGNHLLILQKPAFYLNLAN